MDHNNEHEDSRSKALGKKILKKEGKKLIVRTIATAAASTAIVWVPIVLILFLVFIVVLSPYVTNQEQSFVAFVSPTPSEIATPSGTITPSVSPGQRKETPDCANVDQGLRNEFNITITGTGCENKQLAYNVYANAFLSQKYRMLMKNAGNVRIVFNPSWPCQAYTTGNKFTIGVCRRTESIRYLYLHEMGHVIGHFNSSVKNSFNVSLLQTLDRNCYENGYLKSYVYRRGGGKSESIAESVALYVMNSKRTSYYPNQGFFGRSISNFKQECPYTYRTIGEAVYGGYEFN